MENFIVSARKYRPVTFDSVVGQGHITTTLKNALKNNQLAQAFLFCGPRGVGKTTCARILAKTINCLNPSEDYEACGVCESCQAFQKNGSLNIYELDAASNNSVDDIRNLVEQVRFPPQVGSRKVYIIDEVHMLSTSAFNAFLKTLEEPPSYVIFILATTEKHKIIPTILSRCQIFDFKRIEATDIADHLKSIAEKEDMEYDYDALEVIGQKADGGLRDALSLFDMLATFSGGKKIDYQSTIENLHVLDYDYYFKFTDFLLSQNLPETLLLLDEVLRHGFDGHNFINGLAKHFRDLMVCQSPSTISLLEVPEKAQAKYQEQAKQASVAFLLSALNLANDCDLNYKNSKEPRLLLELTLMKIAHIPSVIDWSNAGEAPASLEKKNLSPKPANNNGQSQKTSPPLEKANTPPSTSSAIPMNLSDLAEEDAQEQAAQKNQAVILKTEMVREALDHFRKVKKDVKVDKILNRKYEIIDNHMLKFSLTEAEAAMMEEFKEEFIERTRKRLRKPDLQLQVDVYTEKEARPYSNFQKFEYLSKKNPSILELQKRLGLDVDM